MGITLQRIDDPRDPLAKARRHELWSYAKENGIAEIKEEMPAIVMRQILRSKGVNRIPIPERVLGDYQGQAYVDGTVSVNEGKAVDADADLARQWEQQQKSVSDMNMTELRKECKRLGIKMIRTDNLLTLREKLGHKDVP